MGGFAAAIEWNAAPDSSAFERMVTAMYHRGAAGLRSIDSGCAKLAEARLQRDGTPGWQIAQRGPLTIVGDINLWNRTALERRGHSDVADDDRCALLAAFALDGPAIMDDVDGDFAFVIWDSHQQTLFAARDRFGVKPLFIERTGNRVLLASEVNQITAFDERPIEPDLYAVSEFRDRRFRFRASSFDRKVVRIMPSNAATVGAHGFRVGDYWSPELPRPLTGEPDEVAAEFREHLTDAVRRRIDNVDRTIGHLSGGLDSSSIAASAHLLTTRGLDPKRFVTASAVFPGTDSDESDLIAMTAAIQPFENIIFEPRVGPIDWYEQDMATTASPVAHTVRDLTVRVREIANDIGAGLVLTGNGGDEVAADTRVLATLIRQGNLGNWFSTVGQMGTESPSTAFNAAVLSAGQALPGWAKAPLRLLQRRPTDPATAPLTVRSAKSTRTPRELLADSVVSQLQASRLTLLLETQEAMFAAAGVEVSHPYLDRSLVEFVASIDPASRPISVANKTMIRTAYAGMLPDDILSKRRKTLGNALVERAVHQQGIEFIERYPEVPLDYTEIIDATQYQELRMLASDDLAAAARLWQAWSILMWLDGLGSASK